MQHMILLHCPSCDGAMIPVGPCRIHYPVFKEIRVDSILICTNCAACTEVDRTNGSRLAEYRGLTIQSLQAPHPWEDMTLTTRSLRHATQLVYAES